MKISYNWLRTYLPVNLTPERMGEILTQARAEVRVPFQVAEMSGGAVMVHCDSKCAVEHATDIRCGYNLFATATVTFGRGSGTLGGTSGSSGG